MLLTNELVESESEVQVMLHLPPWWNPTLEMSSPAVAATQTTNPVGFLGARTLLVGAWWLSVVLGLSVMHLVTSPTPAETNNLTQKTNRYKTPPCTMQIPTLYTQEEFPNICLFAGKLPLHLPITTK